MSLPTPYYDEGGITIYHADCRDILPHLPKVDLVLTDPPYGNDVANWDNEFPIEWLYDAAKVTTTAIAVSCGTNNLLAMPFRVSTFEYRWTLACIIKGSGTQGKMGFAWWIPLVCYAPIGTSLYKSQPDAKEVAGSAYRVDHPSPKPINAVRWWFSCLPEGTVLDPFMGSGTTLSVAKDLGRRAIGIEIEEKYCEIAVRRLAQEVLKYE